jgi:L-2-hydroxyglutarate oxidase
VATKQFDVTIIGAGIVGLATAYKLLVKQPDLRLAILEKEPETARHQTGHNSGVIHSGIYYKPGSLKALNCRQGYQELLEFAKANHIQYEICGKVIVATRDEELPILEGIYERGQKNGLEGIHPLTKEELKEKEPHVKGLKGIFVPQTGIIDYKDVAEKLSELIQENGGELFFNHKVLDIRNSAEAAVIETSQGEFSTEVLINCAGLYADRIGRMTEPEYDIRIIPFRGEYYELTKEKEHLVNNLIYPVPNPDFPFLGVHYTRMIKGGIEAGPNAVLAFRREGYSRWDINLKELMETLTFPGFRKVAGKYWKTGLGEMYRSYSKGAFVRALQHLIPEVGNRDLKRGGAGVRAQACDVAGHLVDDFLITQKRHVINVWNAPSPAATSCLSIGTTIARKALEVLPKKSKG